MRSYQAQHGDVAKKNVPMSPDSKSELDTSPFLDINEYKVYQQIIGTCQSSIVCGRLNICYELASLSRLSVAPCGRYLKLAKKIVSFALKNQREVI